uniref:Uncharacterized protein n=1 Tax=Romanomermis culicivorax TaxID=13658 RepID=A0A915J7M3_ROMCU
MHWKTEILLPNQTGGRRKLFQCALLYLIGTKIDYHFIYLANLKWPETECVGPENIESGQTNFTPLVKLQNCSLKTFSEVEDFLLQKMSVADESTTH